MEGATVLGCAGLRKQIALGGMALLVGVAAMDAYADGLPGEYILTQRWREMFMVHSPMSNPAFLTEAEYTTLRGAFAPVLDGAFKLWELGVAVPIGLYQSAGFTWLGEGAGEVELAEFVPGTGLVLTGETGRSTKSLFVLTYAINPWRRLSVGANVTLAYESNFGDPVSGLGLDLGVTYRVLRHPLFGDHIVGLATQNLVTPAMTGGFPQPTLSGSGAYSRGLRCSWYGKFLEGRAEGSLDLDLKDFWASSEDFGQWDSLQGAWEELERAAGSLEWGLSLRAGGWIIRIARLYLQLGFDGDGLEYWGLVGGIDVPSLNRGRNLAMLYQFNLKTESSEASTHTFYLRTEVGKRREELFARRLARLLSVSPNDLYNRALQLYHRGEYWDAFFVFGQIDLLYPDFFKQDWVSYYMGSCQERLDMRTSAAQRYKAMVHTYRTSRAVQHANLGLMRIAYRNADIDEVRQLYAEMMKPDVSDSLKHHAQYLMGEALVNEGSYDKAIPILREIPLEHPEYMFARHSMALAYFALDQDNRALVNLEEVLLTRIKTKAQKEALNRSCALLGYYFYDKRLLSKAVTALRMVPTTSYYHEDALLGLGWCAVISSQWADCIEMGQKLRQTATRKVLKAEGGLVESYGYVREKRYLEAAALLSSIYETGQALTPPASDSLRSRREVYRMDRVVYDSLAEETNRFARLEQVAGSVAAVDKMHARQEELKGLLDGFLSYRIEFGRDTYFSRPIKKLREDVEYLYAFVKKRAGEIKGVQRGLETLRKQQDIDADIKRLKEELESLEKEGEQSGSNK